MATTTINPVRVPLPEGLVGCIMGGHGPYMAALWLAPLAMDTVITGLTIFKTMQYLRQRHGQVRLIHVILRDGLLYFAVILVANLLNCVIYYVAPPDLKVIGASFSQIITIIMISRLQLNLRSSSICSPNVPTPRTPHTNGEHTTRSNGISTYTSSLSNFFASTVSELGKDIGEGYEGDIPEKADEAPVEEFELKGTLEVGPIRPVSGGTPAPMFSPEEIEWLDTVIQVSPAMVDEENEFRAIP
ncbi:hypothetical protein RhiJN_05961 [Ceratobasidium sp. AG-Ba]|nr:hypothetical protein RhiJN_05961 [Ceratobasidium sp. AG-Ba]QRW06886.1 hypothetical protein RhiLY_05885 [Ceratobasidium sp. AG-Ba]